MSRRRVQVGWKGGLAPRALALDYIDMKTHVCKCVYT